MICHPVSESQDDHSDLMDNQCLKNVATNFGIGATLGSSIGERAVSIAFEDRCRINRFLYEGAVYGTWDSFRFKVGEEIKYLAMQKCHSCL